MNSGKPRTFLQKIGDVFVSIAAVLFKIFLVALVILCCPVLFVLAVVLVALVFAAIAVAVSGGALLYELLPAIDWMPVASVSPMMTLLGTIAGVALIGIPLGAFLVYHLAAIIPLVTDGSRLEMVAIDFMDIGCGHYGLSIFLLLAGNCLCMGYTAVN